MATSIFFNGRLISVPGSYSEVDPSGLESVGLSAAGIVAVLGTAEGGRPASTMTEAGELLRVRKPESGRALFRSGDLREVMGLLFEPAADPDIAGGAVEVVAMKINPATKSQAQLPNGFGPALMVWSRDYGAFTEQIKIAVADGTVKGKLVTVQFEDQIEAVDDLGGDTLMRVEYTKPTGGWDVVLASMQAGGVLAIDASRDVAGLDTHITALGSDTTVEVVSADVADTARVTLYGLDDAGTVRRESLTLAGTTPVVGTTVWGTGKLLGARITGTTAGIVTVRVSGGGATVMTIAAGINPVRGMVAGVAMYGAGVATIVADGASVGTVILSGKSAAGAAQIESLTLNGAAPVVGTAVWSEVDGIVVGNVAAARTVELSGAALRSDPSVQNTLQKLADYVAARAVVGVGGFGATLLTPQTRLSPGELDVSPVPVGCIVPAAFNAPADLHAIADWISQNSQLIEAEVEPGAVGGAPTNTASPVFLSGGSEGTSLFSHWQGALDLLKRTRVNSVVVLTGDPAVHAALEAHCAYMGGIGRSERDGFVGVLNTAQTGLATKTEAKAQIVDLNSRHIRAWAQSVDRFDSAGERRTFPPQFGAAILAGMQAGSPVGTPLTFKLMNALSVNQHTSWNPTDDAEELVQAGLVFAEPLDGVGRRIVRNITTYRASNNLAFTEGSVNEAVNYAAFTFRTNMELAVGKRGFSGTVNAAKGVAIGTLGLLVDEDILVATRSLDTELVLDVLEVSVEMAPVLPINFVRSILHLVTVRQSA